MRAVCKSLSADARYWAETSTEEIGACLEKPQDQPPYFKGAYAILKWWYFHALTRPPNPSREKLSKVSG